MTNNGEEALPREMSRWERGWRIWGGVVAPLVLLFLTTLLLISLDGLLQFAGWEYEARKAVSIYGVLLYAVTFPLQGFTAGWMSAAFWAGLAESHLARHRRSLWTFSILLALAANYNISRGDFMSFLQYALLLAPVFMVLFVVPFWWSVERSVRWWQSEQWREYLALRPPEPPVNRKK